MKQCLTIGHANAWKGPCSLFICLLLMTSSCSKKTSGCASDLECKGERICVNGACIAPVGQRSASTARGSQASAATLPSIKELREINSRSRMRWKDGPPSSAGFYERPTKKELNGLRLKRVYVMKGDTDSFVVGATDTRESDKNGLRGAVLFQHKQGSWQVIDRVVFPSCQFHRNLKVNVVEDGWLLLADDCILNQGNGRCVGADGYVSFWSVVKEGFKRTYELETRETEKGCGGEDDPSVSARFELIGSRDLKVFVTKRNEDTGKTKRQTLRFTFNGPSEGFVRR